MTSTTRPDMRFPYYNTREDGVKGPNPHWSHRLPGLGAGSWVDVVVKPLELFGWKDAPSIFEVRLYPRHPDDKAHEVVRHDLIVVTRPECGALHDREVRHVVNQILYPCVPLEGGTKLIRLTADVLGRWLIGTVERRNMRRRHQDEQLLRYLREVIGAAIDREMKYRQDHPDEIFV